MLCYRSGRPCVWLSDYTLVRLYKDTVRASLECNYKYSAASLPAYHFLIDSQNNKEDSKFKKLSLNDMDTHSICIDESLNILNAYPISI